MTLYMIGIGLHDEKDITVKGLEAVRKCSLVFLEYYTSKLAISIESLERFYGKKLIAADRDLIESRAEAEILEKAIDEDVALLVIGDPLGATTHTDIMLRAKGMGADVIVIHNASVLTAVGLTGLELYKFGKITSIPFYNDKVRAPIEVLAMNEDNGLHTLFLLDLDPANDKFMTVPEACSYLKNNGVTKEKLCIGCAGLGADAPEIKVATLDEMIGMQFTLLPQCLIIPGLLHFVEEEALDKWKS